MNMHAFHKWLFSAKPSQGYRHALVSLSHLSCKQLMAAAGALTWYIWNAETSVTDA